MGACLELSTRRDSASEPWQRVSRETLHTTAMAKKRKDKREPLVDISEDDQWRIIQESGVLNKIAPEKPKAEDAEPLLSPFTEECFAALSLIIPFSFLLLMMEMYVLYHVFFFVMFRIFHSLVHYQYGRKPTYEAITDRMIPGVPSEYIL
jgi:hypothetical protein